MPAALTRDTFFNGRLQVKQHRSGYRYSIDAVILAHRVRPKAEDRVLDLGTGCGIIPMVAACRFPNALYYGVEIQPELAAIADENVRDNRLSEKIRIIHQDLKTLKQNQFPAPFDLVVCNPPYRRTSAGRINPNSQRAVARHEIETRLSDVVAAAGRLLKTAGKFIVIYSAERLTDLLSVMRSIHIEPKFLQCIHSRCGSEAKLILLEGIKSGNPGMKIAPPLLIYQADGSYSAEVAAMFQR
jgi:tRNA1Val (adenine37-N6)-methyltransferase